MNAAKYLMERNRMCRECRDSDFCSDCPFSYKRLDDAGILDWTDWNHICGQSELEHSFPIQAAKLVEKWSKMNPAKV